MKFTARHFLAGCLALASCVAHGVIIRDDIPDAKYVVPASDTPALVDLPGEGGGALIAPQWFVTAGHAVNGYMLTEVMIGGKPRKVGKIVFAPGFRMPPKEILSGDSARAMAWIETYDDIALVKLAEPVRDVEPLSLYRGSAELGKEAELFGKGATGNGISGEIPKSPHRGSLRRAQSMVTHADKRWIGCTFVPGGKSTWLSGILGHGDSGSPVLIQDKGRWELAGLADHVSFSGNIESFVQGKYGQTGFSVRISYYAKWIDSVVAEAPVAR